MFITIQGCVAVQTFPVAARPGNTITISVGSPDGMTKANTDISFVPQGGDPQTDAINLNSYVRSIFKLRPDNTSGLSVFDPVLDNIAWESSHSPWITIIAVDLPGDLPVGAGTLHVSTAAVTHVGPDINDNPVEITILDVGPGEAGAPNPFNYRGFNNIIFEGTLGLLEPLEQVVVKPPLYSEYGSAPVFHAVEFKLRAVAREVVSGSELEYYHLRVVADDQTLRKVRNQTQMFWSKDGDVFTVNFICAESWMDYQQNRFSVVVAKDTPSQTYEIDELDGPELLSVRYFDSQGNEITAGLPQVGDYSVAVERP
jgi:hypothetical protein